jgi:hypothetical protein
MKRLICYALLLFSIVTIGQSKFTISGYIQDSKSGEKLIGVNVYSSSYTGCTTNEYGYFSLILPEGKQVVFISYLGYITIEKEID